MKHKPLTEDDLATPCNHCGYRIPPREVMRVSFDEVRCPKCGKNFNPAKPGPPLTTS